MRRQLSLEAICGMDNGRIRAAFDNELAACLADCGNRPGDGKTRKLVLMIEMKPKEIAGGELETIISDLHIKSSLPPRRATGYTMRIDKQNRAFFSDETPENPDQMALGDVAERNI